MESKVLLEQVKVGKSDNWQLDESDGDAAAAAERIHDIRVALICCNAIGLMRCIIVPSPLQLPVDPRAVTFVHSRCSVIAFSHHNTQPHRLISNVPFEMPLTLILMYFDLCYLSEFASN